MDKLQKYIHLIIRMGLNIHPGEKLLIWCPVEASYFARMIMEAAYNAQASVVTIHWVDEISDRIDYLCAPDSRFDLAPEWETARAQYWTREGYKMLWVDASDPEIMSGIDPERIQKGQRTMPAIPWTVVSVPTQAWACKVFPNAPNEANAVHLLWNAIYAASRINENDPLKNWCKHIDHLQEKVRTLMGYGFRALHFTNQMGTDLQVALPSGHIWTACVGETASGEKHICNIPTEEVFTAPLRTGVNGIAYGTMPLVFMGETIDGFWLRFQEGRVVDYAAQKNEHLLKKLLSTHENANYLGEVALVPNTAPLSLMGLLWYDTSFDENAACHLALGSGYPQTLRHAEQKSWEERLAMGLNQSAIHEDFMIGSPDMDITGITSTGEHIPIFRQGEWAI